MNAQPIPFPRQLKRGPKVKSGPCATVSELPNNSAAALYARFMDCRYTRVDQDGAAAYYAENMDRAQRGGYTHTLVREGIRVRREQLLRELDALDRL